MNTRDIDLTFPSKAGTQIRFFVILSEAKNPIDETQITKT